jgi:hypothetical protein
MDSLMLMHEVMNILTPYLGGMGTAIAGKIGEDIYARGKNLYQLIQARFSQEPDDKASKALQSFVGDPDFSSTVEIKLLRLIEGDSTFAQALFHAVQAGPQMVIEAYDDAAVRRNTIENSLGRGSQKIIGSGNSVVEENHMKIRTEM